MDVYNVLKKLNEKHASTEQRIIDFVKRATQSQLEMMEWFIKEIDR